MTDSTIAPPKTCDFLTTNISWLLDMRKGAIMKKASSTYLSSRTFLCLQRPIDRRHRGGKGRRISGNTRQGAGLKETGDFVKEKLRGLPYINDSDTTNIVMKFVGNDD